MPKTESSQRAERIAETSRALSDELNQPAPSWMANHMVITFDKHGNRESEVPLNQLKRVEKRQK
jgi:hypothetical protein